MSKFDVKRCNNINGKIAFFKLIENEKCHWDEFCKEIQREGTWAEQLDSLISQMDDKANMKLLPETKYRDIDTGVPGVKCYEFKSRDLRAYCMTDGVGIIIFAGRKSTQSKDISKFKSLVKQYKESKK